MAATAAPFHHGFKVALPAGPTNAQATAVAVGAVSEMDKSEGAFYSTGPAYWSYSFDKDDTCRPVTAVHGNKKTSSSGLADSPQISSELSDATSYGAPDFNAMIAAAMYDSIRSNHDYILRTQYEVGADLQGNLWNGMTTAPVLNPKGLGSKRSGYSQGYHSTACTPYTCNGIPEEGYGISEEGYESPGDNRIPSILKRNELKKGDTSLFTSFFDNGMTNKEVEHRGCGDVRKNRRMAFGGFC